MKKTIGWVALAVVLSWCYLSSPLKAQGPVGVPPGQPMQSAAGTRIALLDVLKIYKNHARFKGMMEDMKADYQRAETQFRGERDAIVKLEERLQEFHKGTPDYKGLEEEITHRKADLNVKIQIQGKEFQQRQARIYYNVYQEISQATDYFCQQHGIDVVLQVKGDGVDPEQFESVGAYISKSVVWSHPSLDITDSILRELNRTAVNAPREATRPAMPFNNNQPQR